MEEKRADARKLEIRGDDVRLHRHAGKSLARRSRSPGRRARWQSRFQRQQKNKLRGSRHRSWLENRKSKESQGSPSSTKPNSGNCLGRMLSNQRRRSKPAPFAGKKNAKGAAPGNSTALRRLGHPPKAGNRRRQENKLRGCRLRTWLKDRKGKVSQGSRSRRGSI